MKKKIISTLLCTAMLATMVAGCGVEKSDGGSDTEGSASSVAEMKGTGDNEINILIYAQDHEKAVYQELIDKFTKEHADEISTVNFEVTTQDEYATKMTAAMTAGELPDIFYVGPEAVRSYVDNGYVQPLDDLVDATAVDNLWPAIKSAYMYDGSNIGSGSLYCLPKDLSCFAFAYNKDLFDEAGLEYPDPENPYTWEEFADVCQKLTKDKDGDGEIDQWGVANANAFGFTPYVYGNGGQFLNDDQTKVVIDENQNFKDAFQYYTDLTLKYKVTPTVEQDTALGGYQRWLDGQVAFYACGTWDVAAFMDDATFPYNWDLCGWPVGPNGDGKSTAWLGTVGFAVSSQAKNPDLCAELIQSLSTDLDGQVAFYACGTWDVAAFMDDATFPYNWDLCGWPVGPNGDGKSTAWLGTVGFAVSSQAKNPDLCAELIQSLSTDLDGQKELCGETSGKSLQIPNIMDYAQTTFKDKVNDGTIPYASNVDVIFGYIEGSDKYKGIFTETTYTYNSEWWDTFLEGMPNVLTGEVSVDDYCKQVAPKMQEALDNAIELQNAATNN